MKLSISFKEILSRAFQVTRLERTSVLFWCFVFRSSRCLIYKVHAAFAAGLYFTTFHGACQALFQLLSKFSERLTRLRLTRTHLFYQIIKFLSRTFFRAQRAFSLHRSDSVPLARRSDNISNHSPIVNTFFQNFHFFFPWSLQWTSVRQTRRCRHRRIVLLFIYMFGILFPSLSVIPTAT